MPDRKDEVLLRVEHLCQYFKENKAVDDVSFGYQKGRSLRPGGRIRLRQNHHRPLDHQVV